MATHTKDKKALKALSSDKLAAELKEAQESLYMARMKHGLGELKETHELKVLRRYVAQLKTLINTSNSDNG